MKNDKIPHKMSIKHFKNKYIMLLKINEMERNGEMFQRIIDLFFANFNSFLLLLVNKNSFIKSTSTNERTTYELKMIN